MNSNRDESEEIDAVVSYCLRNLANLTGRWRRCPSTYPPSMVQE